MYFDFDFDSVYGKLQYHLFLSIDTVALYVYNLKSLMMEKFCCIGCSTLSEHIARTLKVCWFGGDI